MANIESNTLLEKLTQINNIKNRLRQTIINIGGGDYISEKSPFAAFPRAISRVHSDINNVSKLLEYIDLGGNLEEIVDKENAMYKDTIPYIDDILVAKQSLVDNLRIKGVYAEVTEPFDSLVEKVLRIVSNAPSPTPEGEFAFTFNVSNGDCKGEYTISSLGRNFDNNYDICYSFKNTGSSDLDGVIIKMVQTISGDTHINSLRNIPVGHSTRSMWEYREEDYNKLKSTLESGNVIFQIDSFENCNQTVITSDLANADVDGTLTLKVYNSDYLLAHSVVGTLNIPEQTYLPNGFVYGLLNTKDNYSQFLSVRTNSTILNPDYPVNSWGDGTIYGYDSCFVYTAADMGNNWYSYTAFLITYVKDGNYEAMRETNTQIETDLYLKTEYYHVPNFLNGVYARSRLYRPSGNAISSDYNIKYKYNDTTTEPWEEQDESFLFMNGQGYAVFANCYSDTNHSRRAYETLEPIISID